MNRKLTASLLILAAVLANVGFAALGSIFNYPDVLDEPAGKVLASFSDHQGAVSAWFSVLALSAALLAPIAIGVGRLATNRAMRIAVPVGIAAAVVQVDRPAALADPRARLRLRRRQRRARASRPPPVTPSPRRTTSSAPPSARRSATCSPPPGPLLVIVALGRRYAGRWFQLLGGVAAALVARRRALAARPAGRRRRELHRLRPLERVADRLRDHDRGPRATPSRLAELHPEPGRGDHVSDPRRRWLALAVLCASLLAIVIDNTIVNVALPSLARDLEADIGELQWVVDAYTLVFAGLLLVAGALGDRYGRRRMLLVGLAVFGAASAWAAYSGGTDALIAARAVMGAGAALIMPATLSLLISVFTDPRERGMAIGIWAATAGLGVALGPVVGGFLLDRYWWGSIFIVNVPLVAVALVAGCRFIPESRDPSARRIDWIGAGLSGVGPGGVRVGGHRGAVEGLDVGAGARRGRAGRVQPGRVRDLAAPHRGAAARSAAVQRPALHRCQRDDHGAVLRAVRVPLPVDAVPAVRPRLLAMGGRAARAALRRSDDRLRAAYPRSS